MGRGKKPKKPEPPAPIPAAVTPEDAAIQQEGQNTLRRLYLKDGRLQTMRAARSGNSTSSSQTTTPGSRLGFGLARRTGGK